MFKILNESWMEPIIINKSNIYIQIVEGMKLDEIKDLQSCLGYLNSAYNSDFPDGITTSDVNEEYEEVFDELREQSNRADIAACQGKNLTEIVAVLTPFKVHIPLTDLRDYKINLYGTLTKWAEVMQRTIECPE